MAPAQASPWLHRFAVLTAVATFLLLGAGGMVTSHGAGMAVPDWPNTYGYNMFFFPVSRWVGGIFYEHTHRLAASMVGLFTTILAIWFYGRRARLFLRWTGIGLASLGCVTGFIVSGHRADGLVLVLTGVAALLSSFFWPRCESSPSWLRRLGLIAFFAVVLQGVLGGLRVVLYKDQIGIFHATLAQLFFSLICSLAFLTRKPKASPSGSRLNMESGVFLDLMKVRRLILATTVLVLFQLVLGATMRHQHAGLAIPDFPLAYGKWWPAIDPASVTHYNQQRLEITDIKPITAFQIVLQMVHRFLAVGIFAMIGACFVTASRAWQRRATSVPLGTAAGTHLLISRLTLGWLGLVSLQVLLGAATIWSNKAADIATVHVLIGALTLALGAIQCIILYPLTSRTNFYCESVQTLKIENCKWQTAS